MTIPTNAYIAIMAGGQGTRFWPKSKSSLPKQFLDILGTGETLLQSTFKRSCGIVGKSNILVVTNKQYAPTVREQLLDLPPENILTEPVKKDTGPCLAFVTYYVASKHKDAILIALPSDHMIKDKNAFNETISTAVHFCKHNDTLLILGIEPTSPHTGYGYIQIGEPVDHTDFENISKVKTFTEKPNSDIANELFKSGEFLWNAGIFIWSVHSGIKAIEKHMPIEADLFEQHFSTYLSAPNVEEKNKILLGVFERCRQISIDYALLEKASNVFVIASYFDWNDLGSWSSTYELQNKDEQGNTSLYPSSSILLNTRNSLVDVGRHKLVVIDGLDDYIVVDTDHALLICKKENDQNIKNYLDIIKEKGKKDYL